MVIARRSFVKVGIGALGSLVMAGCGGRQDTASPASSQTSQTESSVDSDGAQSETGIGQGEALVAYFSVPETTSPDNMSSEGELSTVVIDGEVLGNTQYVARLIAEGTGAELYRIEPTSPYPMDHAELESVAQQENRDEAFPQILAPVDGLGGYGTVFVGYPNWYGGLPRIMYSFFQQNDLSGKTVVPFVTSGGSGFSNTIATIAELAPGADVIEDGLSVNRTEAEGCAPDVEAWLSDLGY